MVCRPSRSLIRLVFLYLFWMGFTWCVEPSTLPLNHLRLAWVVRQLQLGCVLYKFQALDITASWA